MTEQDLINLAQRYAQATGTSLSRVGTLATQDHKFFRRLESSSCSLKRANVAVRWFSDNWPANAAWPAGLRRPTPTWEIEARNRATEIGADGRIADAALFVSVFCRGRRNVLDYVLGRYADGSSLDEWPRNSLAADVLEALIAAGDCRFSGRRQHLVDQAALLGDQQLADRYAPPIRRAA